jgi:hypothetical protein
VSIVMPYHSNICLICSLPCSDDGSLHAAGMNSRCSMVQLDGQLVHCLATLRGRTTSV